MDWQTLFLNVNGRMGQRDYWISVAILFVAGFLVTKVPFIRSVWPLFSLYVAVCIYGKRLHDIGQSAWMVMVPIGLVLASFVLALVIGGSGFMAAYTSLPNDGALLAGLAGMGVASLLILLAGLAWLGWVIWLGIRPSDPTENQFGPPREVPLITAF
jgi:uncharacterized membrane protein YhaH (DUF805 family)